MPQTPEEQDRLIALGRVAANGVACEQLTTTLLAGFIAGNRDRLPILLSGMSWDEQLGRLQALGRLVLEGQPNLFDQMNDWVRQAHAAKKLRNAVVHSSLMRGDDGDDYSVSMPRNKGMVMRPSSTAQVHAAADVLRALYEASGAVVESLRASGSWDGEPLRAKGFD